MIWYLIICGLDPDKSDCTFSPPFTSQQQCEFVKNSTYAIKRRDSMCIGLRK